MTKSELTFQFGRNFIVTGESMVKKPITHAEIRGKSDANGAVPMSNRTCSTCGVNVSPYDGVSVEYKEETQFMCSMCYNESIAEHLGLERGI